MNGEPTTLWDIFRSMSRIGSTCIRRGKIQNIQFPELMYLAYNISRGVIARENAWKITYRILAIMRATTFGVPSYNIGAIIARRLDTNGVKGPLFGGVIASRILSWAGMEPRPDDVTLPEA